MSGKINEIAGILLAAGIIAVLFSGVAAAVDKNYGENIDEYKGVWAKSNGIYAGTGSGYWQCVEYVKRFYKDALLVDISQWSGNAGTYYGSASAKGLWAYPNSGSVRPKPNDILAFSGNTYGHVAIIKEVGSTYVRVIEQNWARNSAVHEIPYNAAANRIGDANGYRGNYRIQGWLRKEAIELISPNGGEVWRRNTYQTIQWKYYGDPGTSVKIELLKGSTVYPVPQFGTVSIGSNGKGSYGFVVTQPAGSYKVRITSSKGFGQSSAFYTDTSNSYFTVQ